jgi:hypothetical protein
LDKLQKHLEKAAIKPEKTFYLGPSLQALKTLIAPDEPKASDPANLDELQKTLQELSKKMGSQPSELPLGEAADPVPAEPVAPAPQAPAAPAPAPAPETAPPGTPTGQDPSGGTQ